MIQIGLYPHKCKQCGKKFEGRSEWVYKLEKQKGSKDYIWFCSHKCIRQYEKDHTKVKKPSEREQQILDLLKKGYTPTEAAKKLGITYGAVAKVRDKWTNCLKKEEKMITEVDYIPSRQTETEKRMEKIKANIFEIITNRVRMCEILDIPYVSTNGYARIKKAIRLTCSDIGKANNLKVFDGEEAFTVSSHRDENGDIHFYVKYDPELFDKALTEGKIEK